ncbi:MAG: aquaporin, partial [Bacteroidota bacterium]
MTAFFGELIGTAMLMLLGNGVVANTLLKDTKGHGAGWLVITIGWGLAVFVSVFIVASVSGAHINPAVTLGLAMAGTFAWSSVPAYLIAQFIGAAIGA